jgi:hypothetical protein
MPPSSNTVSVATDSSISLRKKSMRAEQAVELVARHLERLAGLARHGHGERLEVAHHAGAEASMQALRSAMGVAAQAGWAARAAAALAATDAASSAGRVVMSWPLAGLWMASVFMIVWRARQPESR